MRRATILTAALAVLGTAGPLAPSPVLAQPQTRPATEPVAAEDLTDPAILTRLLLDPASSTAQRELAAARLVADPRPEAISGLASALSVSSAAPAQAAAAKAVAGSANPDERLVEPLLALLTADGPANIKREVGRALGAYRGDANVRARLAELAISGPSATRRGAVSGLARLPEKESAQALMLLLDGDAPEVLEREAAEALAEMTGQPIPNDDLLGWQDWWEQVAPLDEAAFKAHLLDRRALGAAETARRAEGAAEALLAVSRQRYRSLAAPDRPAMLEEYLRSPLAELREAGARLVLEEEANFARDIPPEVMRLVRAGITDPEPRVRAVAAQIVQRQNDTSAIASLLAQVGRETSHAARLAQVRALGSLGDPAALPTLMGLLNAPSPGIRSAAAHAAADLAVRSGPENIREAANAIRQAFLAADATRQSGRRLRAELIAALADLPEPSLREFYRTLMTQPPRPSRDVRAAALRGMGTLGDPALGDTVVMALSDDDARVREEAVRALARTSRGFERANQISTLLSPRNESSEAVRAAAWQALTSLFPRAQPRELENFADFFQAEGQPDRRLAVLRVIAAAEEAEGDFEQLAWRRHEMAGVLLEDLNQPSEAAELYRAALDYSLESGGPIGTIKVREKDTLRAYLRARRFDDAINFAAERLTADRGFEESLGSLVKEEASALSSSGQPEQARTLIEAVLERDPPLVGAVLQQQLRDQLEALDAPEPG